MVDHITIAVLVLFVVLVVLAWRLWVVEKRFRRFMQGKDGSSLEHLMNEVVRGTEEIFRRQEAAKGDRKVITEKLSQCLRHPATVRFNPFQDSGGNQSFATAFLNEQGDGVIVSSLYAHGKTSIFAKPVKGFASAHELTEEEQQVLSETKLNIR